jgi:hypothetical protein
MESPRKIGSPVPGFGTSKAGIRKWHRCFVGQAVAPEQGKGFTFQGRSLVISDVLEGWEQVEQLVVEDALVLQEPAEIGRSTRWMKSCLVVE